VTPAWLSPFLRRAPARLAFPPTAPATFSNDEPPADYFFLAEPLSSYEGRGTRLSGRLSLS
jgi:hypothetical protein